MAKIRDEIQRHTAVRNMLMELDRQFSDPDISKKKKTEIWKQVQQILVEDSDKKSPFLPWKLNSSLRVLLSKGSNENDLVRNAERDKVEIDRRIHDALQRATDSN